jgi:predicted ABC-type ATPase
MAKARTDSETAKKAQALREAAELGCTGAHRHPDGTWMACSTMEEYEKATGAEKEKSALDLIEETQRIREQKGSKRKRKNRQWEKLREQGVSGIDTLPGGGLVSGKGLTFRPVDGDTDVFDDIDKARRRARQLGCIGVSRRTSRSGRRVWTPCTNMTDYARRTGSTALGRRYQDRLERQRLRRIVREELSRMKRRKKRLVDELYEFKVLGGGIGRRGARAARFDPNAWDGDNDGIVQEGTPYERPAIPGVNTNLPGQRPTRQKPRGYPKDQRDAAPERGMRSRQVDPKGSSAVNQLDYDDETEELAVTFASGQTYIYGGITGEMVDDIESAPSIGRAVNELKANATYVKKPDGTVDGTLPPAVGEAVADPDFPHPAFTRPTLGEHTEMVPIEFFDEMPGNIQGSLDDDDRLVAAPAGVFRDFEQDAPIIRKMTDDLTEDIRSNGLKEALMVNYNPQTGDVNLEEGNHRLIAARRLGMTHVPVRMNRTTEEREDIRGPRKQIGGMKKHHERYEHMDLDGEYLGVSFKPSQVGVPTHSTSRSGGMRSQRYDIRPDDDNKGKWRVVDTGNRNAPLPEVYDSRQEALRAAIRRDRGGMRSQANRSREEAIGDLRNLWHNARKVGDEEEMDRIKDKLQELGVKPPINRRSASSGRKITGGNWKTRGGMRSIRESDAVNAPLEKTTKELSETYKRPDLPLKPGEPIAVQHATRSVEALERIAEDRFRLPREQEGGGRGGLDQAGLGGLYFTFEGDMIGADWDVEDEGSGPSSDLQMDTLVAAQITPKRPLTIGYELLFGEDPELQAFHAEPRHVTTESRPDESLKPRRMALFLGDPRDETDEEWNKRKKASTYWRQWDKYMDSFVENPRRQGDAELDRIEKRRHAAVQKSIIEQLGFESWDELHAAEAKRAKELGVDLEEARRKRSIAGVVPELLGIDLIVTESVLSDDDHQSGDLVVLDSDIIETVGARQIGAHPETHSWTDAEDEGYDPDSNPESNDSIRKRVNRIFEQSSGVRSTRHDREKVQRQQAAPETNIREMLSDIDEYFAFLDEYHRINFSEYSIYEPTRLRGVVITPEESQRRADAYEALSPEDQDLVEKHDELWQRIDGWSDFIQESEWERKDLEEELGEMLSRLAVEEDSRRPPNSFAKISDFIDAIERGEDRDTFIEREFGPFETNEADLPYGGSSEPEWREDKWGDSTFNEYTWFWDSLVGSSEDIADLEREVEFLETQIDRYHGNGTESARESFREALQAKLQERAQRPEAMRPVQQLVTGNPALNPGGPNSGLRSRRANLSNADKQWLTLLQNNPGYWSEVSPAVRSVASDKTRTAAREIRNPKFYGAGSGMRAQHGSGGRAAARKILAKIKPQHKGKEPGKRTLYYIGGTSGAGKSSVINSKTIGIPDATEAAHIDPDAIKPELEGFDRHSPMGVQEPAIRSANGATRDALNAGADVVYQSTGKRGEPIDEARKRGDRVVAHFVHVPVPVAEARVAKRYRDGGLNVPPGIPGAITDNLLGHWNISKRITRGEFDEFHLWDNDVPKGSPPKLIAFRNQDGHFEIIDRGKMDDFFGRGVVEKYVLPYWKSTQGGTR